MTGNQIRKKRLELGYTTDKLARKVGVSLSTIQNGNVAHNPRIETTLSDYMPHSA